VHRYARGRSKPPGRRRDLIYGSCGYTPAQCSCLVPVCRGQVCGLGEMSPNRSASSSIRCTPMEAALTSSPCCNARSEPGSLRRARVIGLGAADQSRARFGDLRGSAVSDSASWKRRRTPDFPRRTSVPTDSAARDTIDAELVLSASEIASYAFCFVPMSVGPSTALLDTIWSGAA
jgi:hypothetical protein